LFQGKVQDLVRDDKKTRTEPSGHAELVSASVFFLLSADTPFIPVYRTGFSGVGLINMQKFNV
jgi:hypothetical protein